MKTTFVGVWPLLSEIGLTADQRGARTKGIGGSELVEIGGSAGIEQHVVVDPQQRVDGKRKARRLQ